MLAFFYISESSDDKLAPKIEEMDRMTLRALGPAMVKHDSRPLRLPIRNVSYTATPVIAAGRLLLFIEYFMWAHRFSPMYIVDGNNPGLLPFVVNLLGLKSETRQHPLYFAKVFPLVP